MTKTTRDTTSRVVESATGMAPDAGQRYVAEPAKDILSLAKNYARDKPDVAAMWAFGIGIVIGWKLKA